MAQAIDRERAWQLLLMLVARARLLRPLCSDTGFAWRQGSWQEVSLGDAELWIEPGRRSVRAFSPHQLQPDAEQLCLLLLPLVVGARAPTLVVGHLGQSFDGRVARAAASLDPNREDAQHTRCLRALFDAVIVGVRTVQLTDPDLSAHELAGQAPTRVVLDPHGKLRGPFKVLEDGAASTLVITSRERISGRTRLGNAEWVGVDWRDGGFDFSQLRAMLAERGLSRLFVEGGGATVSRFLRAGALDRLHVSVSPALLGAGAPAFALSAELQQAALNARFHPFTLGNEVLFDCEFTPEPAPVQLTQ